ncbi:MAG: HlyD family type I secretion periplasmic adaptor subunit [Magnetococcales bacterium]|nr:HlyD family type I secretion periplasmic adaptor subunit [Magnetococcales bacterium]
MNESSQSESGVAERDRTPQGKEPSAKSGLTIRLGQGKAVTSPKKTNVVIAPPQKVDRPLESAPVPDSDAVEPLPDLQVGNLKSGERGASKQPAPLTIVQKPAASPQLDSPAGQTEASVASKPAATMVMKIGNAAKVPASAVADKPAVDEVPRKQIEVSAAPKPAATMVMKVGNGRKEQVSEGADKAVTNAVALNQIEVSAAPKPAATMVMKVGSAGKEQVSEGADKTVTNAVALKIAPSSPAATGIGLAAPRTQVAGPPVIPQALKPLQTATRELQPGIVPTAPKAQQNTPGVAGTVPVPQQGVPTAPTDTKKETKPDWLVLTRQEPESLHALLEPDPEEIARLKQGYKQHRFMAQSVILEESGLSNQVRSALLAVSLVIVSFIVWASFSTMDEITSTQGQVMPASPAQLIQHLEGGIVREIFVVQGQVIKEGALIVRLDKEGVLADLNQLRAKGASLRTQEIRIRAFLADAEADFSTIPAEYQSFVLGQTRLLQAQRSALNGERQVLESRIAKSGARITNLQEQIKSARGQKQSLAQQLAMKSQGVEKGVVSRLVYLDSRRDMDRVEADEVRIQGDLATAKKEKDEAMGELEEVVRKARETNLRELGTVTTDLAQTEEQIRRLSDRVKRLEVRSPVWGVVNNLQVETVGGVLAPGALIAEIIPMDSTRRVETHISPRDIGHVAVGQSVTVKVTTYDFARYGGIGGILESVSPTTYKDPQEKEPFYKGIIRLEKPYVGMNEKLNPVLPGMTVQADIDTGSKTLMEYMLKPIYASVNKAFRER